MAPRAGPVVKWTQGVPGPRPARLPMPGQIYEGFEMGLWTGSNSKPSHPIYASCVRGIFHSNMYYEFECSLVSRLFVH